MFKKVNVLTNLAHTSNKTLTFNRNRNEIVIKLSQTKPINKSSPNQSNLWDHGSKLTPSFVGPSHLVSPNLSNWWESFTHFP